jgi:hypothetical protein
VYELLNILLGAGVISVIGNAPLTSFTADCIDTDLPAGRGYSGQSGKPLIEIAHVHHPMWVMFTETRCREARERKRERRGLLRLLLAEFRGNDRSVELMLHNPEFITYSPDEAFVDEAWKQSRVRLAQLLPYSEDFDLFSAYYENQGIAKGLS